MDGVITDDAGRRLIHSEAARMHRFEVRIRQGAGDPRAEALQRQLAACGAAGARVVVARVYLIHAALSNLHVERIAGELLRNPVLEVTTTGSAPIATGTTCLEVHPLPGVMDPPALTVEDAVRELTGVGHVRASTGWRYDFTGLCAGAARRFVSKELANSVVQGIHDFHVHPAEFPQCEPRPHEASRIPIRECSDGALQSLSRDGHLFLSLDEMHAIQSHYRSLDREPTEIELETIAQTWSEHCVHKTLKSDVLYRGPKDDIIDWSNRPGHEPQTDGSILISNLLKSTVAAATHELIAQGLDWTLSVFVDNAGIIEFDEKHAVCVKVETHNHPSAIEPYGGAATGVGGCIRDIIGTGLSAKPIANTDVFCVAYPGGWSERSPEATGHDGASESGDDRPASSCAAVASSTTHAFHAPSASEASRALPAGCLHPKRILKQVVAGVRDYGNRMGVPTISGAVYFDDRYVGNPLVFCGSVGIMPKDKISGDAQDGDVIVALGGRTGRDGIHGATFSSSELTDTHAAEFSHAVQIGNAIEEKKALDAILRARDAEGGPLFHAITDCGAGGFSSAIGEMGEKLGAEVHLERAPLKYEGLSSSEIWISEAQERMVLAVPSNRLAALRAICEEESVEMAELGVFGTPNRELTLKYDGAEVGRLSMEFLHDGPPRVVREAVWTRPQCAALTAPARPIELKKTLRTLLAHPNIASKRWIIRQYDHEVQGATVLKPLIGPCGVGPGDASVIQPVAGSRKVLAISQGLAVGAGDPAIGGDPYRMALAAVDECVRNLVCVGADPFRIAILDNFCWPSCENPENLGFLVRASEGCYDAAKAYCTPFISGKDSLNNQFTTEDGITIEIPPTLLITGVGVVQDIDSCVTSDAKQPGSLIVWIGRRDGGLGGSLVAQCGLAPGGADQSHPLANLSAGPIIARTVARLIEAGVVLSAHDVSEGGALVAIAEMLIGGSEPGAMIGCELRHDFEAAWGAGSSFAEWPHGYLLEVSPDSIGAIEAAMDEGVQAGGEWVIAGALDNSGRLRDETTRDGAFSATVEELGAAFFGTLDW